MTEVSRDIPEFLKPRAEQKAKEEIQRWEEARSGLIEKRRKILEAYKIISGLDKEGVDRKGMGIEYQFETAGQGRWQVLVGKGKEMKYSSPPELENWRKAEIARDLTINQTLGQTVSGQENSQMRAVNFLEANWNKLAGIFSPEEKASSPNLESFTNVKLGSVAVDFIGVGADGRYMVFEIAKAGRKSQAEQYQQALINLGVPEKMITVFSVNYSTAARQTALLITQK